MTHPNTPISPLRARMLDDLALRKLEPKTQAHYIRAVENLTAFLKRSPATASAEDLRQFQLDLVKRGVSRMTINATITGLRFFFSVTVNDPERMKQMSFVRVERKLPVVLSVEEVAQLIGAAPNLKSKALLSVAYGAGLRASEVCLLKVSDIDSQRQVLRVEQGKGRSDRYALLSPTLLDVLRRWWAEGNAQLKVMSAIERCRSAALGGHLVRCEACERTEIAYNSCRNRHCPKCQGAAAKRWLAQRESDLLPVSYFHVVFTVPSEIADIAYQNKAVVYNALFKAAAQTLLTIGADPKHLGAQLGMIAVLHTWGSAMTHHPHLHCIVPGGGLSRDGQHWVSSKRPKFLVSVRVLSMLFRRLMLEQLASAQRAGQLQLFAALEPLRDAKAFDAVLRALKKRKWYIDARPPFAGPAAVLQYLSRYTHRVAIANSRLLAFDEDRVTFRWKDYRAATHNRYKTTSLRTPEFIRRFLIHVLPHGFHRIRHYGLFANGQRSANLTKARACLNAQAPIDTHDDQPSDEAPPALWLTCRACGQGMRIIEIFQPAPRHRGGDPPWCQLAVYVHCLAYPSID